ncbi:MAG: hypothetical protein KJ687_02460, partial [Proteobacteria bacterium]|nr:hypothetical protein [Pseudomonadota bacterium]
MRIRSVNFTTSLWHYLSRILPAAIEVVIILITLVLGLIGDCGFDALQVASEEDEVHYRYLHRYKQNFGRAVPIIASDAHCADN